MINDDEIKRSLRAMPYGPDALKLLYPEAYVSNNEAIVPKHEVPVAEQSGGAKADTGKARYDLIPPEALEALAELYSIGAVKYGDRNWEKGLSWGRVFAALMRHAWKWWRGETYDPVDKQHHMIALAWGAIALYTYQIRNVGTDDRKVK